MASLIVLISSYTIAATRNGSAGIPFAERFRDCVSAISPVAATNVNRQEEEMLRSISMYVAVALGLSVAPGVVRGDERYYMFLFAAQSEPKTVRLSHTFAVFVKASGTG